MRYTVPILDLDKKHGGSTKKKVFKVRSHGIFALCDNLLQNHFSNIKELHLAITWGVLPKNANYRS